MTNGSLMKVESIAKFCDTFDLHEAIIGLGNQFFVFLRVVVLDRFYCNSVSICNAKNKHVFFFPSRQETVKRLCKLLFIFFFLLSLSLKVGNFLFNSLSGRW